MLSKSQARLFFLVATLGFSGVFLWLTVDTLLSVPERSNEDQMSESVVRGKMIFEENNCMGCHTILGEGAYYAPELTKVVDRRGEAWLKVFLKDPQAMFPGQRKMVQYNFDEHEIDDTIAFLTWIGNIDTNGFPPEPDLVMPGASTASAAGNTTAVASDPVPSGQPAVANAGAASSVPAMFGEVCVACHALGGTGGAVGPALDDVGNRYDAAAMRAWLADPQTVKPGTAMPNLNLTDAQLTELTDFLMKQGVAQ